VGGVTPPSISPYYPFFPDVPSDISFKDDITVILLLGVHFILLALLEEHQDIEFL
jgi:hypothetical protein